ncbi:MAG: hypothetical protein ACRCX2_36415 [Paraclostridium sp.]
MDKTKKLQEKVKKLVEQETDINISKIESLPQLALSFILDDMRDRRHKIKKHKCEFKRGSVKVVTVPNDEHFYIAIYYNEKLVEESKVSYNTIHRLENIIKDYI